MNKQIYLIVLITLAIVINSFCTNQNHGNGDKTNANAVFQKQDSINHANGRRLFGMYCLTCHTFSKKQALLGNTKNISLDTFISYVLKDSVILPANKGKNAHVKFDTLTKKNVSDIKYYLDRG